MGRTGDGGRAAIAAAVATAMLAVGCSGPEVADPAPFDQQPAATASGLQPAEQPAELPAVDAVSAVGGVVRLSELMYHAPLEDPVDEFFELTNVGDRVVNLHEWCVTGAGFCFLETTLLEPGAHVVVRQSEIDGTLSNGGERLEVRDPLGLVVDAVEYDDVAPWPTVADGGGASLHRTDFGGFEVDAWAAAPPTPGGPFIGGASSVEGDLVITEIHYHPADDDPAATFVEVVNRTSEVVDLAGWCIRGTSFCWADDESLVPGGVIATVGRLLPDDLSRSGERLRLVDPGGAVHDTVVYEDSGEWPAVADGTGASLHRRSRGSSGEHPGNWDAAEPSPGVVDEDLAVLPIVRDVEFGLLPSPSDPIGVAAMVEGATSVVLAYVVDFGPEVEVAAAVNDGQVTVSIPPQPAGSLVRFRLVATASDGTVGTWPRAGDGMRYGGTVVTDPAATSTDLPRLQWFMPDEVWAALSTDRDLHGDEGYPVVVALDGEVFDDAIVRIKGNQARLNRKKKWKVMLPAGHHWDAGGLLRQPVDQFDLLPAATDKSFSREILVADLQQLSGGLSQQVFPLRLERNGEFLGLYMYGESTDGDWRDLMGFGPDVYVWKAELVSKLRTADLTLSAQEFGRHYERVTMGWLDDDDVLLRDLIVTINSLSGDEAVAWAYDHVDVPQVVEALATMRIVQHSEWQHKNYYVMFDPADERWRLVPIDFDLTFGAWYHAPCNARCDDIVALPYLDYPDENRLARIFLDHEPFRSMVDRRTRELAEVYLAEGRLEDRMLELLDLMADDAALDRQRWGAFGEWQTMETAQRSILRSYLPTKRRLYLGADSLLPDPQPADPALSVTDVVTDDDGRVVSALVVNSEDVAVDISNRTFDEFGGVVPPGVVIPGRGSVTVVFDPTTGARGGTFRIVAERTDR